MKRMNLFYAALCLFCGVMITTQLQAQSNPCEGDQIGIRAGTGTVTLNRQACDQIVLSYDKFFELEVASRQNDSLRALSLRYIRVMNENLTLRDSLNDLNQGYVQKQEKTIRRYQELTDEYKTAAEDALANAKFAERRLTIQKIKTPLFAIGGLIGGALVGVLVGNSLGN